MNTYDLYCTICISYILHIYFKTRNICNIGFIGYSKNQQGVASRFSKVGLLIRNFYIENLS